MAPIHADPTVSSSDHVAYERRLQQYLAALQTRGWEQHTIIIPPVGAKAADGRPLIISEPYGYVRVSTIMQRIKGYSIPKQLRDIAEAAQRDGAPIPEGNLLGDADSGRKFERDGLQTLLARARERRVSVVYFSKVDRIGRNARDSLNIVHELSSLGIRIIVLEPRLDTKDPFGYFLFVILAAMAELEATFILERTMGGKLEKLAMDSENELPAPPPGRFSRYGYRYIPSARKGERGHWEPDPEQRRWVLWMFTRCAADTTPEAIATALNAQCVPAPQGDQWYAVTVRRLLRCRDYLGEM